MNNPINYNDPTGHVPTGPDDDSPCLPNSECYPGPKGPTNPWVFYEGDNVEEFKQANRLRKQAEYLFLREFNLPLDPNYLTNGENDSYSAYGGCNTLEVMAGNLLACEEEGMHASVDTQKPSNTPGRPIYSVAYGTIVYSGSYGGFGNYIVVEHDVYGEKFYSVYAHLERNDLLSVGTVVDNNSQIGTMGNTNELGGTADGFMGVHLHFEVRKATNVNSSFGVGGQVWWPATVTASHNTFVDLSPIFGKGAAYVKIP